MAEPLNLFELLAAPQSNATLVECGQVGAFRRPAHVRLCPALHHNTEVFNVCHQPLMTLNSTRSKQITYCSLFSCDWLLSIVRENGGPLSSFVDHAVLVTAIWVLNPMAHITLNEQRC